MSFTLFACKNRKETESVTAFKKISAQDALLSSETAWNFYSARARVELDGAGLTKSVDAVIKMQKDSVIWVSVSLFGLEGARVFMHKDSITILNKLQKTFFKISWKEASNYVGTELDLHKTQSLILGNLLQSIDSMYKLNQDSALYFIERIAIKSIYKVKLDSFDHRLKNSYFRGAKTGKNLKLKYSSYTYLDSAHLPGKIELNAKDGDKRFRGVIKLSNMNMGSFGALPVRVPSSFKRN